MGLRLKSTQRSRDVRPDVSGPADSKPWRQIRSAGHLGAEGTVYWRWFRVARCIVLPL